VDERFLRACFPGRLHLLGRTLSPFCLRHYLHLAAVRSPFLENSRPFTVADLFLAVRICANESEAIPSLLDRWRFWQLTLQPELFQKESARFVIYLEACSTGPRFWEKLDGERRRHSVPWVLHIFCSLLRLTHLPEERVWTMPLGLALWINAVLAQQEGASLDFLSEEDEALLQQLAGERS
jgi:hypothetical protein